MITNNNGKSEIAKIKQRHHYILVNISFTLKIDDRGSIQIKTTNCQWEQWNGGERKPWAVGRLLLKLIIDSLIIKVKFRHCQVHRS